MYILSIYFYYDNIFNFKFIYFLQYSPPDENPTKKEPTHSALLNGNGNSHENNKNHNNKKSSKLSIDESGKQPHNNHSSANRKKAKNNKNNEHFGKTGNSFSF